MKTLQGKAVSPGYARGRAFIYGAPGLIGVPRSRIGQADVPAEIKRFEAALRYSVRELESLRARIKAELGRSSPSIFEAHLALLHDPEFVNKVKQRMRNDLVNAEHAVELQIQDLERLLGEVENEYLRERTQDIRDVGRRVLKHLSQRREDQGMSLSRLPPGSVVVAEELLPSDTVDLDRPHVVALVTTKGGETSHVAILARAMGLPYITGVERASEIIAPGDTVLVDATAQTVTVSPSQQTGAALSKAQAEYDAESQRALAAEARECVTSDGIAIALFANLGRADETAAVKEHHLAGVGLFRTEYLFLNEAEAPSLEKQSQVYARLARALHPSVLRAIGRVAEAGHERGRVVCVCGEAAGDPAIAALLVGLGIRQLSMSPSRAARVHRLLCSCHAADLKNLAQQALRARGVAAVKRLAEQLQPNGGAKDRTALAAADEDFLPGWFNSPPPSVC